jgi:hypothetical protein
MNTIPPELITVCGLALAAGIFILLAALLVLQIFKGSIFGLGLLILRMFTDPKEEEETHAASSQAAAHHDYSLEELRSKAEALDFDAAVQKYRTGEIEKISADDEDDD